MSEGSKPTKYQKKKWYSEKGGAGSGSLGGRGRGGGRGARGGRGFGGRGGGRGGFQGGPGLNEGGEKKHHLGRYRDEPIAEKLNEPGIIATAVQNKEKSAERELIEALEQAADELYPETIIKEDPEDDDLDLEELLKKELEGMNVEQKSNRFRLCLHETTCVFYINVLPPLDPIRLVRHILEQTEQTAKVPFRYLRRIVPVQAVCSASLTALKAAAQPVIENGFDKPGLKYGVFPSTRCSTKLDRLDMIKTVADVVTGLNNGHTVDLSNQERTIIIELHKGRIGVSVVQDYARFAKYNPFQLAEHHAAKAGPNADDTTNRAAQLPASNEATLAFAADASDAPPKPSHASLKQAGRERRAAEMAKAPSSPKKLKPSELSPGGLESATATLNAAEVEIGEILEGDKGNAVDGEEWVEVIEGGKVTKTRITETA